ncbi:MAG: hypothetical protein A2504_10505 [Bdellovibrionales bacterium RIFOXYD12_FULL_39_22]|nr:MAG: hypothetical protein A2385_17120 [Bdellovibrionales bacterium RIFOXYB1_FULL_39_21]OFZ44089.1 MAG: hypothetical protein A2485_14120 [Bdellovibrionales bacterium RIFOXYC12_FULL_39_17]OFZ48677.1 MAG: hypothetical protein A2404_08325 [Bdellovibrionales bacterium RIFOXYC1_FULL_39_130]OFZ74323.1 MAG: hypothetical protein A2451_15680 [Bdellovibrionales bacterium RIFOXYC2_FULL_39_8]OFZ76791.1 MAG: hypothetical protein A2560_10615 [Bdellovibrionales bacterium RIFOXYD1_FULL_39_84]OFZ95094.1 MAG:
MEIRDDWENIQFDDIIELYRLVGWDNYTDEPSSLKSAFLNSTYVAVAIQENKVCGVARSISDDVSIHYLQDIIVAPNFQRQGVGRKLLNEVLKRFAHVRTHLLLTDDEEKQVNFYKSLGYSNTRELKEVPLNAFVKMNGIDLK